MRSILHLTDSWGPGGAETIFAELAAGLDPARFASIAGLPRADEWLYGEVCKRGLTPLIFPSRGAFDMGHLRRLVATVNRLRIDVIQAHTFGTGVYASAAGLITRTPVVCTLHGRVDLGLDQRGRAAKWMVMRTGASRVVCVSRALSHELEKTTPGLDPAKIVVIYNGIDVDTFRPRPIRDISRSLEIGPADVLVGAVGNVRRIKGYEVLIEAAATLEQRGVGAQFVILGQAGNDVQHDLQAQIHRLGLDGRVRFLGFRTDTDELYRSFDLYALTSHSEGFPLSMIQALASGLPVVATRCGGPEEMIEDGVEGFLVARGSGREVADALAQLAHDPLLRARMGTAAREKAVAQFSTQAMVSQYEELYEELAPHPRRGTISSRAALVGAAG